MQWKNQWEKYKLSRIEQKWKYNIPKSMGHNEGGLKMTVRVVSTHIKNWKEHIVIINE